MICAKTAFRSLRKAQRGFTLVETLLALAILVLLTGLVASGIPMAFGTYAKAVDTSNAQATLTTATTALRNELGLASDVYPQPSGDEPVEVESYVSAEGYWTKILNGSEDEHKDGLIILCSYIGGVHPSNAAGAADAQSIRDLVTRSAITRQLNLTFSSIKYKPGVFIVEGLTITNADGQTLASSDEPYEIKAIMLDDATG